MKHISGLLIGMMLFVAMATDAVAEGPVYQVSTGQILASARNDDHLTRLKELEAYAKSAPRSTPYLDKVEVRTQTEEFDLAKQKYSLRFYPKGWGETECMQNLQRSREASMALSYADRFNTVIRQRYDLILDYLDAETRIRMEKSLLANLEDQIHILQTVGPGNLNFNVTDLTRMQDAHMNHRLEINKLENRLSGLALQIAALTGSRDGFQIPTDDLISVAGVSVNLRLLPADFDGNNFKLMDRRQKIDLAGDKYELEKAKSNDYLSFFDVSYDSDHSDDAEKAVAVELAFRLPFINKDRDDINQKKVAWIEEKIRYQEIRRELMDKEAALRQALDRFLGQYTLLTTRKTDGDAAASFEIFRRMDGVNPLDMLKIRESMIRNDIEIENTRFDILRRYIELLDIHGMLSAVPLVNHLSDVREVIQ